MVEKVSKKVTVPLVFLTYLNPVFKYGYKAFCRRCAEAGISGLIIPDLPFEERGELEPFADRFGISTPEQAGKYSKIADGVIVGSAIVKLIEEYGENAVEPVEEYVRKMVEGCREYSFLY